jgi:hypothetical protein
MMVASRVLFALHDMMRAASMTSLQVTGVTVAQSDYELLWRNVVVEPPIACAPPYIDVFLAGRMIRITSADE